MAKNDAANVARRFAERVLCGPVHSERSRICMTPLLLERLVRQVRAANARLFVPHRRLWQHAAYRLDSTVFAAGVVKGFDLAHELIRAQDRRPRGKGTR